MRHIFCNLHKTDFRGKNNSGKKPIVLKPWLTRLTNRRKYSKIKIQGEYISIERMMYHAD